MKYIFWFFLLLCSLSVSAQGNYKSEIKAHRKHYKSDFLKDASSPFFTSPKAVKKLKFFKANDNYKVQAKVELTKDSKPFKVKTYSGNEKTFTQYAWAHFKLNGQSYKLALYQNARIIKMPQYKNSLFLPFKDYTNDESTYGGGRYIDLETTDIKDGQVTLDFNKCYNPYCAFATGYNCPVPPIENHLQVEVLAGEKMYKGEKLARPE